MMTAASSTNNLLATGNKRRRSPFASLWLAVATVLVIHVVCWKAAAPLRRSATSIHGYNSAAATAAPQHVSFTKRSFTPTSPDADQHAYFSTITTSKAAVNGAPEPAEDMSSLIDYMAAWQHATTEQRYFLFVGLILWLTFLFAFVGITASDFFCPNLSTIATRLGLSESVAGVTFLAFSNGSPDVFSTFAALKSNSGSLAIGELIGAASFIVSVVAGTMCVIQPFRVARHTFLRDVGFFTIAVSFTLAILWDSHIHLWEAIAMVGLYIVYVMVVAVGSWWHSRKEMRDERIRQARDEYAQDGGEIYRDEPGYLSPATPARTSRSRSSSIASSGRGTPFPSTPFPTTPGGEGLLSPWPAGGPDHTGYTHSHLHQSLDEDTLVSLIERGTPVTLTRTRSRSNSTASGLPAARRPKSRSSVRPSLLGAIEFRDVVNALQADSTARTLAVFGGLAGDDHIHASPISAVPPGGGLARGRSFTGVGSPLGAPERPNMLGGQSGSNEEIRRASWTGARGGLGAVDETGGWGTGGAPGRLEMDIPEEAEPPSPVTGPSPLIDLSPGVENPWRGVQGLRLDIPSTAVTSHRTLKRAQSITSIASKVPSIRLTTDEGDDETIVKPPRQWLLIIRAVFYALFPSLHGFGEKSIVGKATAVLCVPAILALNLTLPVVENEEEEDCCVDDAVSAHASHNHLDGNEEDEYDDEEQRRIREQISHRFKMGPETPWVSSPMPFDDAFQQHTQQQQQQLERELVANSGLSVPNGTGEQALTAAKAVVEVHADVLTRWLTAIQCCLAPVFCTVALLSDDLQWWYPLVALGVGVVLANFAYWCFKDRRHPGRVVLCFVGFFVAMVWILMIVNEVVGVLQTLGHIFGLSDAILGLTIFAMGNSLGDLVANATVARMGFPSMAIAACFGGPMLNILLGVGLSGTYLILAGTEATLHVQMGRTLLVSGVGLLTVLVATLILVPLNKFWMSKRLGWSLIGAYAIVLSINVCVEIWL